RDLGRSRQEVRCRDENRPFPYPSERRHRPPLRDRRRFAASVEIDDEDKDASRWTAGRARSCLPPRRGGGPRRVLGCRTRRPGCRSGDHTPQGRRSRLRTGGGRALMVNGHSRVQAAYDNLRGEQVIEGESASIALGPSGRLRDAILVKDHVGLIHLLARLPDERERFDVPLGRLLQATWVETEGNEGRAVW